MPVSKNQVIDLCKNSEFYSVYHLRGIAQELQIKSADVKSKRQLCKEISEKLKFEVNTVLEVNTILDDDDSKSNDDEVNDNQDCVTFEFLIEPVVASSNPGVKKWINLVTYQRLAKNMQNIPHGWNEAKHKEYFPGPLDRSPLPRDLKKVEIDYEKQADVIQWIHHHGLDIPVNVSIAHEIVPSRKRKNRDSDEEDDENSPFAGRRPGRRPPSQSMRNFHDEMDQHLSSVADFTVIEPSDSEEEEEVVFLSGTNRRPSSRRRPRRRSGRRRR